MFHLCVRHRHRHRTAGHRNPPRTRPNESPLKYPRPNSGVGARRPYVENTAAGFAADGCVFLSDWMDCHTPGFCVKFLLALACASRCQCPPHWSPMNSIPRRIKSTLGRMKLCNSVRLLEIDASVETPMVDQCEFRLYKGSVPTLYVILTTGVEGCGHYRCHFRDVRSIFGAQTTSH